MSSCISCIYVQREPIYIIICNFQYTPSKSPRLDFTESFSKHCNSWGENSPVSQHVVPSPSKLATLLLIEGAEIIWQSDGPSQTERHGLVTVATFLGRIYLVQDTVPVP